MIDNEEYKKVTEQMYVQNLELVRLNKKIESQNKKIESQKVTLEDLLKVKDETLHIVNHQLNTPLSVIKAAKEMFVDRLWDEKKFLNVLNLEMDRITGTIAEFLSARNFDTKQFVMNKTKVDFETLVRSIVEEKKLLKKVRENKMEIKLVSESSNPEMSGLVDCDLGKIKEVISNLLDNAINYSKTNINLTIKKGTKEMLLSIADSGIGISKENISKLFTRFTRLENAQLARPDGTGLGLYVCKKIIEAHGGKIWVESAGEGKGSVFTFTLPN